MKRLIFILLTPLVMNAQKFDIEGHRGCRGLRPENTIQAFLHALSLGVTTLELDVCISKDKLVVVSHEPYMNALYCSHPDGKPILKKEEKELNLYKMNYDQIKEFDSGKRGNSLFLEQQKMPAHKPLLTEVFQEVEKYLLVNNLRSVNYNIEIKSEVEEYNISQPEVAEFSELVYADIIKYIPANRVVLQSFDFEVLKYWKSKIEAKQFEKVQLAALVEYKGVRPAIRELGFYPDIFSPYYKILTKGKVDICHKKGIKVVPWTVNELVDMQKVKSIGADGLITDYPDRAKKLFE